jgi:HK97 gp10 family phage protein
MARNMAARMALDPKSWNQFKRKLDNMEKAVRKQVQDAALQAGGDVLKDAANANAPGPHIIAEVASGRTLKKKRKSAGVKGNSRVVAVGPDQKHWYYRYAESGAMPHDVSINDPGWLYFWKLGIWRPWARRAGGIKKYAFLARAFEDKGDLAVQTMGKVLAEEIEKAFSG